MENVETWVWITVAAVVALALVGLLAVLGSTINDRFTAVPQVGADADADPNVDPSLHRP